MLSVAGPAAQGGRGVRLGADTLSRLLDDLCKPGALERRREGERQLCEYVEAEARDLSADAFSKFMQEVYARLGAMIKSPDVYKRLGAVLAIDELIAMKAIGDDAARTAAFSSMLRRLFEEGQDVVLLEVAAQTLGHLVRGGGPMMADVVERQVRDALPWLNPRLEPSEARRYAAVLILRELADCAPAVFNVHVKAFIDGIWGGLRDPKLHVRDASVAALQSVLVLVEKRETRYRVQFYYSLFESTMRTLNRDPRTGAMPAAEAIHGALMTLGELLRHTGEFLLARYREVVETVLRFKDSKEKLIRRAVIALLPRLAAFAPERFAQDYLSKCISHLLSVLRHPSERGAAFGALADMATSLAAVGCAGGFKDCLPAIAAQVRDAVAPRGAPGAAMSAAGQKGGGGGGKPAAGGGSPVPEALVCVGALSQALQGLWKPYVQQLLEAMVLTGLSETLVKSLAAIADALPELLEEIQTYLLDLLSLVLTSRPFSPTTPRQRVAGLVGALAASELQGAPRIRLALNTLGSFDFGRVSLLEFVREHILPYVDDSDKEVRQAAALACCRVLERHASAAADTRRRDAAAAAAAAASGGANGYTHYGAGGMGMSARQTRGIEAVVSRLLMAAVSDTSEHVRRTVLRALADASSLDAYLAQADSLRPLFVALNDEGVAVRATAVRLVGRLAAWNPAYVAPALRRHLLQLLTDMEASPDSRQREEAAYLLDCLIGAAPKLILPYISPIQKALVAKLKGGGLAAITVAGGGGGAGGGALGLSASIGTGGGLLSQTTVGSAPGTAGGLHLVSSLGSLAGGGGGLGVGGAVGVGGTAKDRLASEAGVVRCVLATLGQLATVAGTSFKPYVSEAMPLVIDAIQDAGSSRKRLVAVRTLGQIVQSAGCVMSPYLDFPQLLSLLLRLLHEGSAPGRREVMRVLGIVGALDPHTHKVNQASLSGEGKLELEGVRPLRHNAPVAGSLVAGTPGGGGGGGEGDLGADLLPSSGLLTSSEDYYPTVAINALMRVLRDPGMGSQHAAVVSSLSAIFRALGTGAVPYLPKVLPVLLAVARGADEPLREFALEQLTQLVRSVRQHIRRFLPELLALLQEFWGTTVRITHYCLQLLAELALSLRDDLRPHIPELLPRFVGLFVEAERSGVFDMVRPALAALEALGVALEEHLHLLLPSLMRLVSPAVSGTPLDVRRAVLRSLKRLLPRMRLAGYSSALLHPLIKVLDGPHEELRRDALDTMCALAVALGQDFATFVPTIAKAAARHKLTHDRFERLAGRLLGAEPPCMSDAEDWEGAGGWAPEIDALAEQAALQAPAPPMDPAAQGQVKLSGQISMLRKAWESSARVTKDDWAEWMRHFSVELLAQSPSPALRACHSLAQVHPAMARELFAAGFVSCWSELDPASQEQLVRSLEAALAAPTIPPEIVTALLNLAEFMEHDDKRLPLDTRTLGALAEKCHAFAKALHYKEMEFTTSPATAIEALIHINNQLRQPEAAVGVLTYAQKHLHMELKESWYEKLCRWDEALEAYQRRMARETPGSQEYQVALLGKMRCLASLAEWQKLSALCRIEWRRSEPHLRKEMALLAAHAAWHMGEWEEMSVYVETVDAPASHHPHHHGHHSIAAAAHSALHAAAAGAAAAASVGGHTATGAFLRAVLSVRHAAYDAAQAHIERARELMSTDLAALVGESYERAYTDMVRVQQLTELEEVIAYQRAAAKRAAALASQQQQTAAAIAAAAGGTAAGGDGGAAMAAAAAAAAGANGALAGAGGGAAAGAAGAAAAAADSQMRFIRDLWRRRLMGVQRNVEAWQSLFSVRNLVVPMHEDVDGWLKFSSLCRKSGRPRQAERMLVQLLRYDPKSVPTPHTPGFGAGSGAPAVMLAYVKHIWATGSRQEALARLQDLVAEIASTPPAEPPAPFVKPDLSAIAAAVPAHLSHLPGGALKRWQDRPKPQLHARAYLRLGLYQWHVHDAGLDGATIQRCLGLLKSATEYGANWAKAWHNWSLFNCGVLESLAKAGEPEAAAQYVAPAVRGFFRSVALGQAGGDRTGGLQDILRLLTLWFNWGSAPAVEEALQEGFGLVSIDTWLAVIPQIIARIHTNNVQVRNLINQLLVRIGRHHPQALMYPLLVACKSQSQARQAAAYAVLDIIRTHSATLVEQAQLVSQELIRIAILWHEEWHEALEEASRLYFGESNVEAMLAVLLPLHERMERQGPTTLKEIAFVQAYGRELSEAYEWLSKYRLSRKEAELHQAWDLYYHVFKRINKQLHALTTLELQYVAPALVRAQGMELAVPGTYIAGEPLVTIAAFAPQLQVISSKQRPRKLTIHGGDGAEYMFLLKGHEDLRQDERVMQLFGLVNSMLAADHATAERDLSIARYAVIPLSPNSGLIGWVPNCDTLHALIREYRDARKIPLNWEHRLMLSMAPDYDHLTVIQKVEVFEYALDSTSGEDLHRVLWLKSRNSEVWLDRRTTYTRSTAVMSMTGYLLGLGDRHPSNLMLDRYSGKLLHIDFGDCFEASMHRDKFPEKVPFRLTRMMTKAMEVSGIEGNFRSTCENVMRVLRLNKDSVMAMLEAFVHDPLINWRLLNAAEAANEAALARENDGQPPGGAAGAGAAAGQQQQQAGAGAAVPGGAGGGGASGAASPSQQQQQQPDQQQQGAGAQQQQPGAALAPHQHTAADFVDGLQQGGANGTAAGGGDGIPSPHHQRGARERELREGRDHLGGDASEVLNERAVAVMTRMSDKLMGRDYAVEGMPGPIESHSVPAQVQRLILQATSHENLAQSYVGWCPFW